jgi:glycosyltransferase involved in cell wall biosynthesis
MNPLVSILIPAYNAEELVTDTIQSALAQTWPHKEIIIVDDGSTDQTLSIARQFVSKSVLVLSQPNQGAAAARNRAYAVCQGDFIQWLDADDILAPDKVARQVEALHGGPDCRVLLSAPWGEFFSRVREARFCPTHLWCDLSPVEWLLRKLGGNLHMQTATWLTSRGLVEAAGPWDTRLLGDDDGEYFCRVLLASQGTHFVPDARVYYRCTPSSRLSHIGRSDRKKDAMLLSMKLHINYIRSLEDSDRVRAACLAYLNLWLITFYPERPDIVKELGEMAQELGGQLEAPRLRWKYDWLRPIIGWNAAKRAQVFFPQCKQSAIRLWDKAMARLPSSGTA